MMDFNDSSNFPAFLHKVSSNYLAPQCSTWQHFGVAQASQKIHMRQTSHCPHSKPAWSQESSITIKSYKIIQFWQTLEDLLIDLIDFRALFGNLSNLMTFDSESSSLPRSCPCLPGRRGSRSRRGASACWRAATVWCNNFKPPWSLGWRTRSVEKLIQWEFLNYSFWEVWRWIQTKDHVELM